MVIEMKPRIGTDCQRRVSEGEEEREQHRDQHAQRRARGIFRQIARIERYRLALQLRQGLQQMAACFAQEHQQAEDQEHGQYVPAGEETTPAADGNRHIQPHISLPEPRATRSVSQLRNEKRGPKAPSPAARLARSHNTGAALFKHYCARYLRGNLNGARAGVSLRPCSIAESPSVDCCVSGGSAGA
jgi:hypothetical protein